MTEFLETPDFRCNKCDARLGAQRDSGEAPWRPSPCYRCRDLAARAEAALRRRTPYIAAGVDLRKALAAYRKLPPFKGALGPVKFDVGHRAEGGTCGRAWPPRRMRVVVGPDARPAKVLEVLVHEMVHLVLPSREGHGERYRLTFRRACRELWGLDVPLDVEPVNGAIAYGMGEWVCQELDVLIGLHAVELFPPDAPVTTERPSRAALTDALVERRAAHAARMLGRAEKRAKAAQRTLTKWRAKVRYYERAAARKGSSS